MSGDRQEQTQIYYDAAEKKLKIDTTRSSLESGPGSVEAAPLALGEDEALELRIFVGRSVVEVFANGRQAVMRRIYPSREDSVGVTVFNAGGPAPVQEIQAWDLMPSNPY